jgi:hypothetical protein
MDADPFDTLTTWLTAQLSRRRSMGLLGVLGLGGLISDEVAADKKPKKTRKKTTLCRDGQTITTSSKNKRKTLLKHGATAGACVPPGPPPCTPTTCAAQDRVCGPLDDGCGRTLACGSCGTGETPNCRDTGVCAACSSVCPPACNLCANRNDGRTTCGRSLDLLPSCTACVTDADCPATRPTCVSSSTDRRSNTTRELAPLCGLTSPGVCTRIMPC